MRRPPMRMITSTVGAVCDRAFVPRGNPRFLLVKVQSSSKPYGRGSRMAVRSREGRCGGPGGKGPSCKRKGEPAKKARGKRGQAADEDWTLTNKKRGLP